jgi:DNA-binding LytR/AlgR family response regulator
MMNCIVIDDEPLAREGMILLIEKCPQLTFSGSFSNPLDAVEILKESNVDLIFLDINMPEISGLEFVKTLVNSPLIIFTTAYPQYATDSYELDAIDYLLKPIRLERFIKAVNKASNYTDLLKSKESATNKIESVNKDFIYIKADRKYFKLFFTDILHIEGLKDYVIIYTNDRKIITAMNVKTIFDQLPHQIFARISKSYIVNTEHLVSCDSQNVYLKNAELPIGNMFRDSFFRDYIEGKVVKRISSFPNILPDANI